MIWSQQTTQMPMSFTIDANETAMGNDSMSFNGSIPMNGSMPFNESMSMNGSMPMKESRPIPRNRFRRPGASGPRRPPPPGLPGIDTSEGIKMKDLKTIDVRPPQVLISYRELDNKIT